MRIKIKPLKEKLGRVLSNSMNKKINVKKIEDLKIIPTRSKNFSVARFKAIYKTDDQKNKELNLILKRLRFDYSPRDFSNLEFGIHKDIEDPLSYTKSIFNYIQGPIVNGHYSMLVRFYGQEGRDLFEEDAGEINLEHLFIEKTPDNKLIEEIVKKIGEEHSKWAIRIGSGINDLRNVIKEEKCDKKMNYNLSIILGNNEIKISELEILNSLSKQINEYLNHPDFSVFFRLIHADLHPGHIYIKNEEEKEVRLVDVTGMRIGPQTFDLVDLLKHPVSINSNEHPSLSSQRKFIENLLEMYRETMIKNLVDNLKIEFDIKKDLDFTTLFYISNIYRDIRAASKGILLKNKNKKLYKTYMELNPKYERYPEWYLADLSETLKYLCENKFENSFKDIINKNLIEKTYNIIKNNLLKTEKNSIDISREIINYPELKD